LFDRTEITMRRRPLLVGCSLFAVVLVVFGILFLVVARGKKGGAAHFMGGKYVAVVPVEGIITGSREVVEQLDDFRKDEDVRAVVVRIDSPGGAVGPSQEIYQAVRRVDSEKPVVSSMGAVAASGGYYVAIGGRKIVANPGTLTGSIGVIIEFTNVEGVLEWAKIRQEVIKSGKFKDIGSPFRQLTDEERNLIQGLIDDVYGQFVQTVTERRKLDKNKVEKLANGMIYSGQQARESGLVDELGDLHKAVEMAGKLGKISGEPEVIYPPKPGKLRDLFGDASAFINKLSGFSNIRIMYLWRM